MMSLALLVALLDVNLAGAVPIYAKEQSRTDALECRDLQETGSRIRFNRVCLTRADWQRAEFRAKHEMWKFERNAVLRPGRSPLGPIG
jgi:hypothetical protein